MKCLTIGGAMVDSIAIIADERIERMSMRNAQSSFLLLEEGRKIEAAEISQHCGGGAINTAVCMARLGADVSTLVKLGKDHRAEMLLRRLDDEGISTRWVMRDNRLATGAAVIISSHERDAAIFTFRGANTLLRAEDLKSDMFAVDLVYVSSLSNESADCFPDIVRRSREAGAKIATNPGIRQLTSRAIPFLNALGDINILALNRVEADAIVPQLVARSREDTSPLETVKTGITPELVRRGFSSGGYEMSLKGFMKCLLASGVENILITNGKDGAYVGSHETITHCPVLPATVASTAGAGDAFASTFAYKLAETGNTAEALRAAAVNAASVVGHADTQTGLLTAEQLAGRLPKVLEQLDLTSWAI